MRKTILLILVCFPTICFAQVIAGVAPFSTHIVQLNHTLTAPNFSKDSVEIDLDCDSIADMKFVLATGNPAIDAPHGVYAFASDTTFKLCAITNTAPYGTPYVNLFELNDTMICDTNHHWADMSSFLLVAYSGTFTAVGPHTASDTFFAYKRTINSVDQYGWFKVSLNLFNITNPFFTLQSYTKLCSPNNTNNVSGQMLFSLYPSITSDRVNIISQENNYRIEILNQVGQTVFKRDYNQLGQHNISLQSFASGHYFVRYLSEKRNQVIRIQKN